MKQFTRLLLLIIIISIFFTGSNLMFVYNHELAHAQTCKYFGGNLTGFNYNMFEGNINCKIVPSPQYYHAQSNIEAMGYHLLVFMDTIILLVLIIGVLQIGFNIFNGGVDE